MYLKCVHKACLKCTSQSVPKVWLCHTTVQLHSRIFFFMDVPIICLRYIIYRHIVGFGTNQMQGSKGFSKFLTNQMQDAGLIYSRYPVLKPCPLGPLLHSLEKGAHSWVGIMHWSRNFLRGVGVLPKDKEGANSFTISKLIPWEI